MISFPPRVNAKTDKCVDKVDTFVLPDMVGGSALLAGRGLHRRRLLLLVDLHHHPEVFHGDAAVAVHVGRLDQHSEVVVGDVAVPEGFEYVTHRLRVDKARAIRIVGLERLLDRVVRAEVIVGKKPSERFLGERSAVTQ